MGMDYLDLRHGGETDSRSSGSSAVAKGTTSHHRDEREHPRSNEDKGGDVEEGDGGLRLSAPLGRPLDDVVVVTVFLVTTRVAVDVGGDGGGGGKGEDKVEEVKDPQDDGPGQGGDEVGQHTVDGQGEQTERRREHGERHLGVVMVDGGSGKRTGQTDGTR